MQIWSSGDRLPLKVSRGSWSRGYRPGAQHLPTLPDQPRKLPAWLCLHAALPSGFARSSSRVECRVSSKKLRARQPRVSLAHMLNTYRSLDISCWKQGLMMAYILVWGFQGSLVKILIFFQTHNRHSKHMNYCLFYFPSPSYEGYYVNFPWSPKHSWIGVKITWELCLQYLFPRDSIALSFRWIQGIHIFQICFKKKKKVPQVCF